VAIVVLVAGDGAGEAVVGPTAAERLNDLGVTRIALLRDGLATSVVLEGWAFDPTRVDEATRVLFPEGSQAVRAFHEIEHVGVSGALRRRKDAIVEVLPRPSVPGPDTKEGGQ
jgi:hypothetical protein